jgi:hypothetical protein
MSNNQLLAAPTGFLRGRFSILLIAFFVLFLLHTFFSDRPLTEYFLPVFLVVILLASIQAFRHEGGFPVVASVLGLATLIFRWVTFVSGGHGLLLISYGLGALFFAFIAVTILAAVLRDRIVTGDTICGALCGYFLVALVWMFLFLLVESVHPGSFRIADGAIPPIGTAPRASDPVSLFLYFSLVTLSTVGFGDIVPITGPARGLVALEGVFGQFYLAVLVARLVGLYTARSER